MAEFVNAIIGLIAFRASIGSNLYNFVDTLKDIPNEFFILLNKVTDFRLFLSKIEEIWQIG
jgi:hypothetical protein